MILSGDFISKLLGHKDFFGFTIPRFLRGIISTIDGWIYTADAELYDLIVKIARQKIFEEGTFNAVAGRVYQLLALIMVFRLIFLFVTYVVNPDDMLDKTKGYQNVIRKMVITLGLIIITPWAFEQSRTVQQLILEEGIIEYFVFGQSNTSGVSSGYEFMHTVGKLFVVPYACTNDDCTSSDGSTDNSDAALCTEKTKWDENIAVNDSDGHGCGTPSTDGKKNWSGGTCANFCGLGAGDDVDYAKKLFKASYPTGAKYDLGALMGLGGAGNDKTGSYYSEYKYPVIGTTLVGILIGYMLIIMCIDVAVRSIKLAFYELIAPIPIISYIGPKDGKETMLNKWFSQVLKTYADLFTRIAGLELAVFFIDTMLENETLFKSGDIFVELFLILGALTFAKKLPDILKDLGVKFEGGTFNLKKKFNDEMLGSKYIKRAGAAGLALAGGAAANAIKKAYNFENRGQKLRDAISSAETAEAQKRGMSVERFRAEADYGKWRRGQQREFKKENRDLYGGSIAGGAISAAYRAATSKDGKVIAGAQEGIKGSVDARDLRDKRQNAGYTFGDRLGDSVRAFGGVDTKAKTAANELRAEIERANTQAYTHQQNASDKLREMQSLLGRTISQKELDDWMSGTATVDPTIRNAFEGYKSSVNEYASIRANIAKKEKKLGIYEQEKK